jgi:NADPH:quinone reductase-like Zn-dependent oxidoreductase
MHMLTARCEVHAGDWVLVMGGSSGVGSAAIQIARELGAQIIATGSTPEKMELARQLGAGWVVNHTQASWASEVRKITGKRGVDVVVEHFGGDFLKQAFHCLARGGSVVTCGATAGRDISLELWPLFVKQQKLIGSYSRDRADLVATLDWAAYGKLKAVIDRRFPLAETPAAFARLRQRQVMGKCLVVPGL